MTRRAVAGLSRRLPFLPVAGMAAALSCAALLTACGGTDGGASPLPAATVTVTSSPSVSPSLPPTPTPGASSGTSPTLTPVTLSFMRDGELCAVERQLEDASDAEVLRALLRGPTPEERAHGVTTAVPRGVRLLEFDRGAAEASVDLSAAFARAGDPAQVQARMAQIVYTVTGLREDAGPRVALRINGVPPDGLPSSDGDVECFPTRSGYRELEPAIFVERPGLGGALSSPFVLAGTASVYEGSFTARLVDDRGRRIVSVVVQASRGAPGRGRFRRVVAFSTSATCGTLLVYDLSMEDASRQDLVRIPVTFTSE